MAANKFATMVHRNTNKMTLILVYAALEWTLIALLLFNSLFSYLIVKFADYFGLKRPCLWCSTLEKTNASHRDLVCEAHAREISSLEFCPTHRRLAESRDLCEDCSASETDGQWSKRLAFFPWTTDRVGTIGDFVGLESEFEDEEEDSKCSCCGASLSGKRFFNPCILIKPSYYPQKKCLVEDYGGGGGGDDRTFEADDSDHHSRSEEEEEEQRIEDGQREAKAAEEENCAEIPVRHLEFYIGEEDCTLIPIVEDEPRCEGASSEDRDVILEFFDADAEKKRKTRDEAVVVAAGARETLLERESETMALFEQVLVSRGTQTVFEDDDSDFVVGRGSEEDDGDGDEDEDEDEDEEIDGEISIGTEIPDHEPIDEIEQAEASSYQEDPSSTTTSIDFHVNDNHVSVVNVVEQEAVELRPLLVQTREVSENEDEERAIPDTPEELRAALKAVYAELEEERSAAAVAASQTMAMINRLQEEKAAVQMEAVQYRRMMEEQSDYDQEALHDLRSDLDACLRLLRDYQARDCIAATAFSDDNDEEEEEEEDDLDIDGEQGTAYTPAEAVLYLEEERLSILDQLRALEDRLFTLSDDDGDGDGDDDGLSNGHCHHHNHNHNHNHNQHRGAVKAKRLLPLFEAAGDGEMLEEEGEYGGKRRGAGAVVDEEVERVYERLQALEADREFLRRCVGSLRKGDKGLRLLSEILRHLRHLKTVEHRAVVDGILS